jgi:hypothetical protein
MTTQIAGTWADPISGLTTDVTATPDLVDGYASDVTARTITHDVIGRAYPDATILPGSLRSGTLKLTFSDENASRLCEQLHAYATTPLVLTTDDRNTLAMTYVVVGKVHRELDDDTRSVWTVSADFQEVTP